jgi:HSP20 family protein
MSLQQLFLRDLESPFDIYFKQFYEAPFVSSLSDKIFKLNQLRSSNYNRYMPLNVYETEKTVVVNVHVPGLEKENINIKLVENTLELETEYKQETEQKDRTYHFNETSYGKVSRSIKLPKSVNLNLEPTANLKNGVLEITFIKRDGFTGATKNIQIA